MKGLAKKLTKKEVIDRCKKLTYSSEEIIDAEYRMANNGGKYWFVKIKCANCGEEHEERMYNFINYRKANKRKCKCKCKKVNKNQIKLLNKKTESENENKMDNVVVLNGKLADIQYLNNDMIKFNLDNGRQGIFECMRIFKTKKEYEEFIENYSKNMNLSVSVFGYLKRNTIFPMYVVCTKPLEYNDKYSVINTKSDVYKKLKEKEKQVKEFEDNYCNVLKENATIVAKNIDFQKENKELCEKIEKLECKIEELNQEENVTLKEIKEALSIKKSVKNVREYFEKERGKSVEERYVENVDHEVSGNKVKELGYEKTILHNRLGDYIIYYKCKLYTYDLFEIAKAKGISVGENKHKRNVLVFDNGVEKYKFNDYEKVYKYMSNESGGKASKSSKLNSWISKGSVDGYKVYIEKIN